MSELRAAVISDAAGTGPVTFTGQYAAKALVGVNLANNHEIYASFNISSVTDDGTGDMTVSVTNSFTQAARATAAQSGGGDVDSSKNSSIAIKGGSGLSTTGGSYSTGYHSGGHDTNDVDYANVVDFGELA